MDMRKLRIEQLSAESGFSVSTIRYYQFQKILSPPKREGRIAVYGIAHIKRLKEIQRLQNGGFSLKQIQSLKNGEANSHDPLLAALEDDSPVSREELIKRSGVSSEILDLVIKNKLVIPIPNSKNLYYSQSVDMLSAAGKLISAGVDLVALLNLALKHSASIEVTAKAAVEAFAGNMKVNKKKLLEEIQYLIPQTVSLVALHFHQTLLAKSAEYVSRKKQSSKPK